MKTGKSPQIIFCLAAVLCLVQIARSSEVTTLQPIPGTECEGKKKCVIVYKAPWCSACRATIPFVKALTQMAKQDGNFGVQVAIGLDSEEGLKNMASLVGLPVHFDKDRSLFTSLGGGGVPRWAVIDEGGTVLSKGSGLPRRGELNEEFREYAKGKFEL